MADRRPKAVDLSAHELLVGWLSFVLLEPGADPGVSATMTMATYGHLFENRLELADALERARQRSEIEEGT